MKEHGWTSIDKTRLCVIISSATMNKVFVCVLVLALVAVISVTGKSSVAQWQPFRVRDRNVFKFAVAILVKECRKRYIITLSSHQISFKQ